MLQGSQNWTKKKKYEDKRYNVSKFEFHAIKEAQDNSEMANFN